MQHSLQVVMQPQAAPCDHMQLTPAFVACVPDGSVSLLPSDGLVSTLTMQPALWLTCRMAADRLRSCACSSYSSDA